MTSDSPALSIARTALRVLTFRATRDELVGLDRRHLIFGFVCTWLVGMGRYWDDPEARLLQRLGVGSLAYVLLLALMLWILYLPMRPADWSYRGVLTFITLVSPPAALYAIPVERFVSLSAARTINVWFLAAVATWRVALLFVYLRRVPRFYAAEVVIAGLLPLSVIVTTLFELNLHHVVFDMMGGIRDRNPHGAAYQVLFVLTLLSTSLLPLLLGGYVTAVVLARRRRHPRNIPAPSAEPPQE